jgi:hypothetical protein
VPPRYIGPRPFVGSVASVEDKRPCCLMGMTHGVTAVGPRSDGGCQLDEGSREPVSGINVGGEFVVAAVRLPHHPPSRTGAVKVAAPDGEGGCAAPVPQHDKLTFLRCPPLPARLFCF